MSKRLAGKAAIVTGGTSGIGKSIVELFREQGAEVLFTGRNAKRGKDIQAASGGFFLQMDAESAGAAERTVEEARRQFGKLDVLVNNAGDLSARGGIEALTEASFDQALGVHLKAPALMMKAAVPLLRAQGGSIINMSSILAHRVVTYSLAYTVSKAGLVQLTRYAASELGVDGIRVNSISPGYISTSIHTNGNAQENERMASVADRIEKISVGRQALPQTGTPADVAQAALYLASDESRFVTGADIVVDGGTMWGKVRLLD